MASPNEPSMQDHLDEVYSVNQLLEIKNMDWQCQLDKAVSAFTLFLLSFSKFINLPNGNFYFPPYRVFRDMSITVYEASCILRNYKLRTGEFLNWEGLNTGKLKNYSLTDSDYDLSALVRIPPFSP